LFSNRFFHISAKVIKNVEHKQFFSKKSCSESLFFLIHDTFYNFARNEQYPVGGIILYAWNIDEETQLERINQSVRRILALKLGMR
jgi:hypothetical protein